MLNLKRTINLKIISEVHVINIFNFKIAWRITLIWIFQILNKQGRCKYIFAILQWFSNFLRREPKINEPVIKAKFGNVQWSINTWVYRELPTTHIILENGGHSKWITDNFEGYMASSKWLRETTAANIQNINLKEKCYAI